MNQRPDASKSAGARHPAGGARAALSERAARGVLAETLKLAAAHLPGAAAVTVVRADGSIDTLGAQPLASTAGRIQNRHGEGPALDACAGAALLHVPDLDAEERWPAFSRGARQLGIRSLVCCALGGYGGGRAALSLYATGADAFEPAVVRRAAMLAQYTELTLAQAGQIASLNTALLSRQVIGEATGILIERHHVDSRDAFAMLVRASQRLNVKLRLIAEHVALTGQDPAQITAADLPAAPACAGGGRLSAPETPSAWQPLRITVTTQAGFPVLQAAGEMDLAASARLEAALRVAQASAPPGVPLVVDLSRVEFCDAGGLRALLAAAGRGIDRGAPLRIVPSEPVSRVIESVGVGRALDLYPDRRRALFGRGLR